MLFSSNPVKILLVHEKCISLFQSEIVTLKNALLADKYESLESNQRKTDEKH